MPKIKVSKKFVVTLIVILLVALTALGAGVLLRWWQDSNQPISPKALPEGIEVAQNLASSGDFNAAHEEINKRLGNNNLSDQEKYELYFQQGSTYFNDTKYKEALDSYKQAAAIKETQPAYELMAETCILLDDKAAAINYFKKAIEFIPTTNPVGAGDRLAYETKIRELGGQP